MGVVFFFFFKQKTAYEMRISDWSSDVCSSDLVNDQLARGRPFFADIARDGIALYEAPGQGLAMPRQLDAQERHAEALRHRDHWFPLAAHALKLAQDSIADGVPRDAAFMLHQRPT